MNETCDVTIVGIGFDGEEKIKKLRLRGVGCGAKRHAERWLKRGWERVSVAVYSASTGKTVDIYNAVK